MRKSLIFLILILGIDLLTVAQEKQRIHVTFYGLCVSYGANTDNYHGYGWQVFHNGAIDTTKYTYFNSSPGGDNTKKVEKEKRLIKKLYHRSGYCSDRIVSG